MSEDRSIIGSHPWLGSPAGEYLLAWEQARIDLEVTDIFGFHALQVGLPQIDALRANRMPHRWICEDAADLQSRVGPRAAGHACAVPHLVCQPDALPFETGSLDLVVLPHTLELAADPHATLAEVDRVLRPEGRVVIAGFNPASLWALRQRAGRWLPVRSGSRQDFLPAGGEIIGYRRLRDWLRLLSFEVEGGRFGCYRPPLASQAWLDRFDWMDAWGDRWWPVFGAVYCCVAVKRVRGMRLVGLPRPVRRASAAAAVAPANAPAHVSRRRALAEAKPETPVASRSRDE